MGRLNSKLNTEVISYLVDVHKH